MTKNLKGLIILIFSLGCTSPLLAASDEITIETDLSVVSDYVYRGLSRSDSAWAIQGSFTALHDDGLYLGVFASSLDKNFNGHKLETEIFGGYSFSKGAYDYDVSLSYDALHGGQDEGYAEIRGSIARDYGLAYLKGGLAYSPFSREIGEGDSVYGYVDLDIPLPIARIPPMSVAMHLGYENYEGPLDKWDWSVGIFMEIIGIEVGIWYHDVKDGTPLLSDNRFVINLKKYF